MDAKDQDVLQHLWKMLDKEQLFKARTQAVSEYGRATITQHIGQILGGDTYLTIDWDERNSNAEDAPSTPENPDFSYLYETLKIDHKYYGKVAMKAKLIMDHKSMYEQVSRIMGNDIPWWFIGALHYRESHCDFNRVLHNGELLCNVYQYGTRLVPKGRGKGVGWSWVDSAVDALTFVGFKHYYTWSMRDCLERAEKYNGLGYRYANNEKGFKEYSPYLFAYSNHHDETGKYVEDGKYDPLEPEYQVGVATLWKCMGIKAWVK